MPAHRPQLLALAIAALAPALAVAGEGDWPTALRPGFATVGLREGQQVRLRLDPDAGLAPDALVGRTIVIRRQTKEVRLPQDYRVLAEHWREVATAVVLSPEAADGALAARIVREDAANRVRALDRAELPHIPSEAVTPSILSITCHTPRGAADADEPAVLPGEHVRLAAEVFCPTGQSPVCTWRADAGAFLHAGGEVVGLEVSGPTLVRWRAPAGKAPTTVDLRLEVAAGPRASAASKTLRIRVAEPQGQYQKIAESSLTKPLFREIGDLAAGPLGDLFVLESRGDRIVHWAPKGIEAVTLGSSASCLAAGGEAPRILARDAVLRWRPGAEPSKEGTVPAAGTLKDAGLTATGDLLVLDTAAVPRVRRLAQVADGDWTEEAIEPAIASPSLACFAVDPLSGDLFVYDSQASALRHWQAQGGRTYRAQGSPISLSATVARFGTAVDVVLRTDSRPRNGPPVHVVFQKAAIVKAWRGGASAPSPVIAGPPEALSRMDFAARTAVALPDGDLALAGLGRTSGEPAPVIAQLSLDGRLRRILPPPAGAPRLVAAAPNGQRYVLLDKGNSIALLGPEGWLVKDLGPVRDCREIQALRPDRASARRVFLIGRRRDRQSAFRVDAEKPGLALELSSANIPGQRIPDHEAVDAASSPGRIAVLDADGAVLLFANASPLRFIGQFDTELRSPRSIALLENVPPRDGAGAPRSYVAVLPSEAGGIHLWQIEAAGDAVRPVRLGQFAAGVLSAPVALESAFPDHPGRLFVLSAQGSQVRAFDVAATAAQLAQGKEPEFKTKPLLDGLRRGAGDFSIGPGQQLLIVNPEAATLTTYARRP